MKLKSLLFTLALGGMMVACTANQAEEATEKKCDTGKVVLDNIMTRKSVRQFTQQPIEKDTIDLLLKAAMAAPSAVDARPWEFVVITERPVLDALNAVHPYANLKTATAAIVVCGDMTIADEKYHGNREYWVQDCCAATENILLAAHGLGLGAVWCGVYPVEERVKSVSEVLGLPENILPLNVITMGYPDENPDVKDKWNPAKIHWQKWN